MEKHLVLAGKIHYFYGNFQLQTVSSPEGIIFHGVYQPTNITGGHQAPPGSRPKWGARPPRRAAVRYEKPGSPEVLVAAQGEPRPGEKC